MRRFLFLLLALAAASAQDFSGSWKLRSAETTRGRLPEPVAGRLEILHNAGAVRCTVFTGGTPVAFNFSIDGKESRAKADGGTLSTVAKWEGSALLLNTIVNGRTSSYTQMDRWRLSRDARTLTITREIVERAGGAEATLVYEAEAAVPPAAVKPSAPQPPVAASETSPQLRRPPEFTVPAGTRIPLVLLNSVSTRQSSEGDRVYLAAAFPVLAGGRVVIPPGSYIAGTLTVVKPPGRVKGRSELFLRFDSLTLPNGVTRDFRSRVGALDGQARGDLDRTEGSIKGEGGKGQDARTVGEAASTGASVGALAGAIAGRPALGLGVGAAAGAAAGLMGVLLTRGPDIVLAKGATLEMVLDRRLVFAENELSTGPGPASPPRTR